MQESAEEGDPGPRAEKAEQQDREAEPGIEAGMRAIKRKGEDCAAKCREGESCECGKIRWEQLPQAGIPGTRRHQCFTTNALKPALSRPFFAASALFWSLNGQIGRA